MSFLILVLIGLSGGSAFLLVRNRVRSTTYLGWTLIFASLFIAGYFLAHAFAHPWAAFHRWVSVGLIGVVAPLMGQINLHFPDRRPRHAWKLLAVQLFISSAASAYFFWHSIHSRPIFRFEGHFWDFELPIPSVVVAVVILLNIAIMVATGARRSWALSGRDRVAVLGLNGALWITTIFPATLNVLARQGIVSYELWVHAIVQFFSWGLFLIVLMYIGTTQDRTSFMIKVLSVTLVSVLMGLQFINYFVSRTREGAMDDLARSEMRAIVAGAAPGPTVEYVVGLPPRGDTLLVEYSRNNASAESFLQVADLSRTAAAYAATAERSDSAQRRPMDQSARDEGDRWNARLRHLSEPAFQHWLASPSLPSVFADRRPAFEKLKPDQAGARTEARVLLSLARPPGQRFYRFGPATTEKSDSLYVVYTAMDKVGRVMEVGFSYQAYRDFLHPPAAALAVMALGLWAVIVLLFPLFFRGSLIGPLQQLVSGVTRVNQGDLSVQVPVRVQDEIGFLATSFNRMVESVRDARADLEAKVQQRTADLQSAYDRLAELDRAKTQFFANVSHELRTPLTLILGPLDSVLSNDGNIGASTRDFLTSALRNGARLLRLINDLLDFSKLEAGRLKLSSRELDLVAFTRETVSAFDSSARAAGLSLLVRADPERIPVHIDPEKMEKVLINLIGNALKFTPEGEIAVELTRNKEFAQVVVRDTGIGIPSEKLELIFERFSQVDGSSSRRYEGTGIGLALVRELVRLHDGEVHAESEPGKGARFVISLPLDTRTSEEPSTGFQDGTEEEIGEAGPQGTAGQQPVRLDAPARSSTATLLLQGLGDPNSAEPRPTVEDRAPEGAPTVLIVEDTADMRSYLENLLAPHFRLIIASNGREGLDLLGAQLPEIIVSDVMMPEMDGYELTRAIRSSALLRDLPIILLTARADVGMRVEGLEQGADDYLVKPFNARELVARIRSQLRIRGLKHEVEQMRDRLAEMNEKLGTQVQTQASELMVAERFRNYLASTRECTAHQERGRPNRLPASEALDSWALTRDQFRYEPMENIKVKGFHRTIPVYRLEL